jgi:hypothetical protein
MGEKIDSPLHFLCEKLVPDYYPYKKVIFAKSFSRSMSVLCECLLLLPFTRPISILSITGRDQTEYMYTVHADDCMFPQSNVTYAQRLQDLYSACLMFWMRTHTGPRFIISSEGYESHQRKVIKASHTNSKILVPDGARTLNLSHWRRTTPLALSVCLFTNNNLKGYKSTSVQNNVIIHIKRGN